MSERQMRPSGWHHSEETKAKIAASEKGKSVSPASRAKMSAVRRNPPAETREKMSISHRGHIALPETRAKMSAAGKGRPKSPEWRAKIGAANWNGGPVVANSRAHAKRRTLGFIPLNAPFHGSEAHHLDREYVIYIPKELHHSVYHNQWTGHNMDKINALAYEWLAKETMTC